jgi:hypothetical protein
MVDTVRTLAALQALLADNTAGDIAPQDHRDELVSVWTPEWVRYLGHRLSDETAHALDDFFDSDTSADYTQTTPSGSATPQIGRDVLSWLYAAQTTQDVIPFTKAFGAISPPITIETHVRAYGEGKHTAGLCFSDGTTTASNVIVTGPLVTGGATVPLFICYSGTITLLDTASINQGTPYPVMTGGMYLRLVWKTTNTFRAGFSVDGVTYTSAGVGDITDTQTPTRLGVFVSTYGGGAGISSLAAFDYLRVYEADLLT